MKYISSSIFGCFFGIPTVIKITDSGLVVEVKNRLIKFQWLELTVPPVFHLSFFGQILAFKTAKKNYIFTMLSYNAKRRHKNSVEQLWANANIKRVDTLLTTIEKITTHRYLRQSTIESIQLAVNPECKRWFPWFNLSKLSKSQTSITKKLQWLTYYQHWQAQGVTDCRESYIEKQLLRYQTFFDKVESNPLTLCQRRACIIDNDNNLLLAGAGTGKTSVMVGRAGYLLNSQQASSEQILLLAYGRKAANEMDERISDKLQTDKVSATTFHSLGLTIIAQVEGRKPSLSVFAEDEKIKSAWIQTYFEKLICDDSQYRVLILEYFSKYYYVERSDLDFNSLGERHQYYNDNDIRSLKGEKIKSFAELYIANWLFTHGIKYQYEANYAHDVTTVSRKQYQPDFFLPQLNIYIEYYGIDNNGDTAPYIDKGEFHKSMQWKRNTHSQFETDCLELTYAQHKQGQLLSFLKKAIMERKIQVEMLTEGQQPQFEQLTPEQIFVTLAKSGRISVLAKIFSQLIGLYKAACLDTTLKNKVIANSTVPKQTEKGLALLQPILAAYEIHLKTDAAIDFEDMINKALEYVQTGQFNSPWRYIMVDEFQDISEPRARLVKALRNNSKECSVFAVGDDWQAIYRFSGADLALTTKFAGYFGATSQSALDQTFRFNNQIGKVATDFISKNPAQIAKTIKSLKQVKAPAVSLLKRDGHQINSHKTNIIDEMANGAIDDVLAAISAKVCKPTSVYLLARFWFLLPKPTDINRLNNQYPLLNIQCQSFHASKGKEADYVIVIGLKKGVYGFPSEKVIPALVDALLAKKEAFAHAEERRLFYVALTRAKDRVYIIADMTDTSSFVNELVDDHSIECHEFKSTISQTRAPEINCVQCETGTLKKQTSSYGTFYACGHFPRCDHTEKSCSKCESPMTRKRYPGFKLCLNESCKSIIPICVKCNAEMVLRSSKKGQFWGCQNFKGNEPMSCKNGVDNLKVNWPEHAV
jgi:DNA helicase-4